MYLKPGWCVCVVGPASFSMTTRLHSSPVGIEGCFPICNLIRIHTPTHTLAGSPWGRTCSVASSSCHSACGHTVAAVPFNIQDPSSRKPLLAHASPVPPRVLNSRLGGRLTNCVKNPPSPVHPVEEGNGCVCGSKIREWASLRGGLHFLWAWGNWNHISV